MSIMSVIKENRVFVAGILLPFLLIALLALAKNIPPIDPPKHAVVFWTKGWSDRGELRTTVTNDQHIQLTYTKMKNPNAVPGYIGTPVTASFYVFTPSTGITKEIPVKITPEDEKEESKTIDVPELANLTVSKDMPSDDGYTFESYTYNRNSLITEIFSNSSSSGPSLTKMGRPVRITAPNGYFNGTPEFVGWVLSGDIK